ncbi:MAG: AI-2E family transporter [Terriglobales bacterium]
MTDTITKLEHKPVMKKEGPAPPPQGANIAHPRPGNKNWALTLLGIGAILTFCYFAEEPLAVILVSMLFAFVLDPVVDFFTRMRMPRAVAAAIAVILTCAALGGLVYFGFNKASNLLEELPKHSVEIRQDFAKLTRKAQKIEDLNPAQKGAVKVQQTTSWADVLSRGFGSVSEIVLAASFVPFLVFFMLTWQEHARRATLGLVSTENRRPAYVTMGLISGMIRSFMVGNLLIGLIIGGLSTVIFGFLHIQYFYFAGFVSGFLSLVPYLGVLLALLPPIFLGIGHLSLVKIIWIVLTVFSLHVVSLNVLYPKILGSRLRLNPLTVTLALLVWGWLWGAVGLILAVPITAGMKIVFDHIQPLKPVGAWLSEDQPPNGDADKKSG